MKNSASQSKNNSGTDNKMKTPTSPRINSNKCGQKCEIYSRVTGYMRPVNNWNKGKKEEFNDRKAYNI
jgi:anaerobic ribonucleoside-triphosphate reductase